MEAKILFVAEALSGAYLNVPDSQVRYVATDARQHVPDKIALAVAQTTAKHRCWISYRTGGLKVNSWSHQKQLTPYFDIVITLSHQDGIILKGQRIVIPREMRKEIKRDSDRK